MDTPQKEGLLSKKSLAFLLYKLVAVVLVAVAVALATRPWTSPLDSMGLAIGSSIGIGTLERQWLQQRRVGRIVLNLLLLTFLGWVALKFVVAPFLL